MMVEPIIYKNSLVDQVARRLREEIGKGTWVQWLPSERELCRSLFVSRNTLRGALTLLKAQKIVRSERPLGTRILKSVGVRRVPERTRTVGVLTPQPIEKMRTMVAGILDNLRGQLADIGYRMRFYNGERYFVNAPQMALKKLVSENTHDCWLLGLTSERVKRWFAQTGTPAIVSGSCPSDIKLPYVDLDMRALCRHAVGELVRCGHRRIAFFIEKSTKTGDLNSEEGFLEGVQRTREAGVEGQIAHHAQTPESMARALDRLMRADNPPTALLVAHTFHYAFAQTYLNARGVRVPQDVSLICRDYDSFMEFLHPRPAHYTFDIEVFSKKLFRHILQMVERRSVARRDVLILPDYISGESLAAPRNARTGKAT